MIATETTLDRPQLNGRKRLAELKSHITELNGHIDTITPNDDLKTKSRLPKTKSNNGGIRCLDYFLLPENCLPCDMPCSNSSNDLFESTSKVFGQYSIKTIDLPKTTYLFFIKSSSTEYLGIHHLYARNVTEQSLGESEFIVYNDEGEVVWENYGSNDRKIFIGADNKIIFAYLHRGYLDIYNIYGKHIKHRFSQVV